MKRSVRHAVVRKGDGGIVTPRMASYDGIYDPSFRYPPFSLDRLLQEKGWQIPEDMLTMSACRAPFNLKRYAILSQHWEVLPAVTDPMDPRHEEAKYYADFVNWCLTNMESEYGAPMDFRTVLFETLRGCWDGFRVLEKGYRYLEYGPYAGHWGFAGFYAKHAKQIGFDLDPRTNGVRHITSYTPGTVLTNGLTRASAGAIVPGGYDFDVPIQDCVLYTYNPDAGLPHGMGDWRGCYKHWWSLDNIARFWNKALERWGSPVLIGQGPGGDLTTVAEVLDGIRDGASAAIPDNIKVQIAQAATGVFDAYRLAAQWHERSITLNIQHNTLTTSEGQRVGSMALGEIHQDTGDSVYDFVGEDIETLYRMSVFKPLCLENFSKFDPALTPMLSLGKDDVGDRYNLMQTFDLAIKDHVISRRAKFIRDEMGWPQADAAEEAMIEQEKAAEAEAESRLADSRNTNQAKAMNEQEAAIALEILYRAVAARMHLEQEKISA